MSQQTIGRLGKINVIATRWQSPPRERQIVNHAKLGFIDYTEAGNECNQSSRGRNVVEHFNSRRYPGQQVYLPLGVSPTRTSPRDKHNFAQISLSMVIYAHVGGIFCVDYRDEHQAYQRQLWCSTREPHHSTRVVHGGHRAPQLEPSPPLSRDGQLTNVSVSAAAGLKLDQPHANRFPRN